MNCPHCGAEMVRGAQFCGMCGSEVPPVSGPSSPPPRPGPPPRTPPRQNQYGPPPRRDIPPYGGDEEEESAGFAVATLVVYFLFWPAGLVMNIIGLVTGPKKGCFWAMGAVFIGLPILVAILIIALALVGVVASGA